MYSLRVSPKGRALLEECAEICEMPHFSKILRIVAYWIKTGRVKISGESADTVEIRRKNGNVIKINVDESYYKNVSEIVTAYMPEVPTASQRDFRIMVMACCLDTITANRAERDRIKALEAAAKAGVDYNVPTKVMELRALSGALAV